MKQPDALSSPPVTTPAAYVTSRPEFQHDRWIWRFATTGTFEAFALNSAFSYTFEGSWIALKDGSVQMSGTRWN